MKALLLTTFLFSSVLGEPQSPRLGPSNRRSDTVLSPKDVSLPDRSFLDAADYYDDVLDDFAPPPPPPRNRDFDRSGVIGPRPRPNALDGPGPLSGLLNQECRGKKTVGHEKYCDLYYHSNGCDNSQSLLRSCPNGLLYTGGGRHGLIGVCDYPHNVECPPGKERHNPPIGTDHCDWLYGIFGHETSCTRYWTCWNGTATEQFCVGGLLYNEDTHACDWPQNVVGCQKHPLCKDDANGNVPLGKSCNRYWACQGGYPRLQRCPAMLVFDKQRKRCVNPPTEDCDVPPTTSPPEDEDGGSGGRGDGNRGGGGGRGDGNRGGGGGRGDGPRGGGGGGQRGRLQEGRGGGQPREGGGGQLPFQLPEGATLLSRPGGN